MPTSGRHYTHKNKHPAQGISGSALCGLALVAAQAGMVGTVNAQAIPDTTSQAQASRRNYDIPAGSLAPALRSFASAANLPLSFVPDQTEGKRTAGVRGQFTQQEALVALLAGSGLLAVRLDSGGYVLRNQPTPADNTPTSSDARTLPTVRVTADAEQETAIGPVQGYVARRSLTATKTDTPILEVPQSISIIGREEMEARGAQDIMEVIRYSPGLVTGTYGPDNRGWEDINLRGFPTYYSNYQNGLAQTPFGVTYYMTDPYMFERVEVLRGPSSMVFGQGDAGGIINRVTKLPTGERIREIELQYGSFQRKQLAFDIGDRFGGNTDLSYRLVGLNLDSNDQDQYPDGRKLNRTRSVFAPSLRWQPDATTSFTLYGEFFKNSSSEDPYYINANGRLTNLKMGDYSYSGLKQEQNSLGYRLENRLDDNWTFRQNFRYSHITLDRRVVWADSAGEDQRTIYRLARTWNDPLTQAVMDTSVQGKFRTESTEHTVLAGVDWNRSKGTALRYRGAAPDLDLYFPVYGMQIPTPDEPLANYTETTRQIGIYAQDQIKIDKRWVVTLGGRQDHVRQTTEDRLNQAITRQKDSVFSGRAGLTYLFENGWAPYLSYAESFLPNAGLDARNDPFKPSRGKQVEMGLKYQPAGSKLLLTGALFDLRKTNVVSYDPVTGEGRQIGKQRSRGLELEAKGELMPGLNATASLTWMDVKILQSSDIDEVGKRPTAIPKQTASVWLDYVMGNGLGFGGGVRYVGSRPNDEHNTSFEPSVTLADASVHYERGPWRFALSVSNLFDRKYLSICYHGECYRGNLRTATLTARYRFQ
ncbi:TonB-dependent siderophore receptor [Variovorax boronicumulans]|uniref:TonB-dependent siderophore receptor n=1 Tax=Variovorax boronicumulans TaxID=436515 RepID=UPI002786E4E6|nr:TonB-dependent siderophore receptor [Variovorax boronicumulans]MDQ0045309.1 iron complex outermembrane receptor protein [Variovorax boronicumulans]